MSALDETALFADVPIWLELILDRITMKVSQILELEKGSVLRLTRSSGDNVSVYVGDVLLGYGEVVVIENSLGIRLTDFAHEQ